MSHEKFLFDRWVIRTHTIKPINKLRFLKFLKKAETDLKYEETDLKFEETDQQIEIF